MEYGKETSKSASVLWDHSKFAFITPRNGDCKQFLRQLCFVPAVEEDASSFRVKAFGGFKTNA